MASNNDTSIKKNGDFSLEQSIKKESNLTLAFYTIFSTGYVALFQYCFSNIQIANLLITISPALAVISAKLILWISNSWIIESSRKKHQIYLSQQFETLVKKYKIQEVNLEAQEASLHSKLKTLEDEKVRAIILKQIDALYKEKLELLKEKNNKIAAIDINSFKKYLLENKELEKLLNLENN